ncbi:hypothetical protein NL676_024594 [Syzygium grande]|nr:hypothetical protein NL676_024594 [Syzygium grande]
MDSSCSSSIFKRVMSLVAALALFTLFVTPLPADASPAEAQTLLKWKSSLGNPSAGSVIMINLTSANVKEKIIGLGYLSPTETKKHYLLLVYTRAQPKQGNKLRRRRRRRKGSLLRDSQHSPGHSALALGLRIESLRPPISSGGGCQPFPASLCGAIDGAGAGEFLVAFLDLIRAGSVSPRI